VEAWPYWAWKSISPESCIDPNGPALLTAVRGQVGLRLESARAAVEVLVSDSVERPMPD
jgi:uncharacterized protein (TIGR03435 family)